MHMRAGYMRAWCSSQALVRIRTNASLHSTVCRELAVELARPWGILCTRNLAPPETSPLLPGMCCLRTFATAPPPSACSPAPRLQCTYSSAPHLHPLRRSVRHSGCSRAVHLAPLPSCMPHKLCCPSAPPTPPHCRCLRTVYWHHCIPFACISSTYSRAAGVEGFCH